MDWGRPWCWCIFLDNTGEAEFAGALRVCMRIIGRGHLDILCAGEMAQWVKAFAIQPHDWSSNPQNAQEAETVA